MCTYTNFILAIYTSQLQNYSVLYCQFSILPKIFSSSAFNYPPNQLRIFKTKKIRIVLRTKMKRSILLAVVEYLKVITYDYKEKILRILEFNMTKIVGSQRLV